MPVKYVLVLSLTRIVRGSDYSHTAALFMLQKGQVLHVLSRSKFLTALKGYNSIYITNKQNIGGSNPNLDLININALTKFGEFLSICTQDIERN